MLQNKNNMITLKTLFGISYIFLALFQDSTICTKRAV